MAGAALERSGCPLREIAEREGLPVRRRAPWYHHKTQPSFGDMLAALRRHLWVERHVSEQEAVRFGGGPAERAAGR